MRVVVTGASGFIGGAVVRRLQRPSLEVLAVSRRSVPWARGVADYRQAPGGDVLIHLAQEADRGRVNAAGPSAEQEAEATLSTLLEKRYAKVVYVSSGVLYSDATSTPHRPDEMIRVIDAYARIKAKCEAAVLGSGADNVVARMANVYGPGMSPGNVVSAVLSQIPGEGPVQVRDATPVRDFLWYEDAARALTLMATSPGRGVFNAGTGIGTSIAELARVALAIAGQPARPVLSSAAVPRESSLILDYSDTCRQYGWRPDVSLRNGLALLLGQSADDQANGSNIHRQ